MNFDLSVSDVHGKDWHASGQTRMRIHVGISVPAPGQVVGNAGKRRYIIGTICGG